MNLTTNLKNLAIAGLIAELCFEFYAWAISPLLFKVTLEPANLVTALVQKFLGLQLPYSAAFAMHFMIGAFGFALTVLAVHSVLKTRHLISGLVAGLALWFVAQGILAPVIGRDFMMGFGSYTQSSFIGHVGMTVIIALVWQALSRRSARSMTGANEIDEVTGIPRAMP